MIQAKLFKNALSFLLGVAFTAILLTQGHYFLNNINSDANRPIRPILYKNEIIEKRHISFYENAPEVVHRKANTSVKKLTTVPILKMTTQKVVTKAPKCHQILCWVMTSSKFLDNRTKYIKETWGSRCDITLYFSDITNQTFPTIGLYPDEEGREWLSFKSAKAWTHVFDNFYNKYDFFVKADDDTYLIVENLRDFLKNKDPNKPEFFGRQFLLQGKGPLYMSGGASIVLSREALHLLIRKAFVFYPQCISYGTGEDMKISRCLSQAGATPVDTRDEELKETFNPFLPEDHLSGNYLPWFYKYDLHSAPSGKNFSSHYPISFHYVRGHRLLEMDYFLYYVKIKPI